MSEYLAGVIRQHGHKAWAMGREVLACSVDERGFVFLDTLPALERDVWEWLGY